MSTKLKVKIPETPFEWRAVKCVSCLNLASLQTSWGLNFSGVKGHSSRELRRERIGNSNRRIQKNKLYYANGQLSLRNR